MLQAWLPLLTETVLSLFLAINVVKRKQFIPSDVIAS
jgi:hypothetical protein